MSKIMKIMLVLGVSFPFGSFSMMPVFDRVVTENASNKQSLFNGLQALPNGEDKALADKYMSLYGDNASEGEDRKKILMSIDSMERKEITSAAMYVVKSLFSQAKSDIYDVNTLNECIRVAGLLLTDAPELANSNPMNNIDIILKTAWDMRSERIKFQLDLAKLADPVY